MFQPTRPISILETTPIGRIVVSVTATDADFGVNGEVRYSITGGNVGNAFAIDPVTGDISVAAALNHTIRSSYTLTLRATDQAINNTMTATTTQVINIQDVNQRPFFITLCAINDDCNFIVSEGEPADTTLQTILAGDPDSPSTPNGQLSYRLDPSDTKFTISNTGDISVNSSLDRETRERYIFLLYVEDGGNPSLDIFIRVTFNVSDINDNAPVLSAPSTVDISEGNPINVVVAQVSAFDSDIEENATIIFLLNESLFFSINSSSGAISLVQSLDFESERQHIVMVRAANPDGLSSDIQNITFNVINENDNSPIFTMNPYRASVEEHSGIGTLVVTVLANDADSGVLGEVRYFIIQGNAGSVFRIDNMNGSITVNGDIDRESVTSFTLIVIARDLGGPSRSNQTMVIITITDINDNAPVFSPPVYFKRISENAAIGTVVGTVTATDADEPGSNNSMITYNITAGNTMDAFAISSSNGSISVASTLDFEVVSNYILTVTGTDQGDPTMNGMATVNITIIDVNDMLPNISENLTRSLSELTPTPFSVAQFTASGEVGDNITFTLMGEQNGEFIIDRTSGIVTLVQSLDFETTQFYEFQVVVNDGLFNTSSSLSIIVLDENDNAPQFDARGPFNLTEEMPSGTLVGQVTATDADSGLNGQIEFSIARNIGNLFSINTSTGTIRTTAVLDREALVNMSLFTPPDSRQVLVVQAEDRGMPSLFSRADVTIQLLDINDNSPQFVETPPPSISLAENIPIGTFILDATATDADLGVNGQVSYSLTSDTPLLPFSINPSTGEVTTISTLDREQIDRYEFSITASDNGAPVRSTSVTIIVNVTDINDNAPVFNENLPITVPFLEAGSFDGGSVEIARLSAIDRDIGRNAEFDFSLGPETDPRFRLAETGNNMSIQVRVSGTINFEVQGNFNVTVIATDRGEPPMSSIALVKLLVEDRDEFEPVFHGPCNASIPESFPLGENNTITQCTADDRDGGSVFYDIIVNDFENPSQNTFLLNRATGAISLRIPLDRESRDSYEFVFTATSSGSVGEGFAAEMPVRINVTDVNDNAPVFTPNRISVTYSDPQSRSITTLNVSDDDINENGEFSAAITSVVRTDQPEDLDSHEIVITAEDMGMPSLSGSATVVVTNGFPCQIMNFSLDPNTLQLTVGTLCSLSNPPVSRDYVNGTEVSLNCTAVSNLPVTYRWQLDGSFIDNPSSDPILNLGLIDFSNDGSYSCIAQTSIGTIQSQVAVINVVCE